MKNIYKFHRKTGSFTSGFTLIELLVVVLIIGILSAVALPQYQKTVIRAKMTEAIIASKALHDAEKIYFLANGEYTNDPKNLDISFEISKDIPNRVKLKNGYCDLSLNTETKINKVFCTVEGYVSYHRFFSNDDVMCCSYPLTNYIADGICKAETGTNTWKNYCGGDSCHCYEK